VAFPWTICALGSPKPRPAYQRRPQGLFGGQPKARSVPTLTTRKLIKLFGAAPEGREGSLLGRPNVSAFAKNGSKAIRTPKQRQQRHMPERQKPHRADANGRRFTAIDECVLPRNSRTICTWSRLYTVWYNFYEAAQSAPRDALRWAAGRDRQILVE